VRLAGQEPHRAGQEPRRVDWPAPVTPTPLSTARHRPGLARKHAGMVPDLSAEVSDGAAGRGSSVLCGHTAAWTERVTA
jgi:hypothetical protein